MAVIGYARVSTIEQDPRLQLDALEQAGAVRVFVDHGVSGGAAARPQLDKALDYLRAGDILVVWKLDRLGRSTRRVLEILDALHARDVGFRSLTEHLTTDGAMGQAMVTIMAAFAQLERDMLIERTRAGLAAAAAAGRTGGRPRALDPSQARRARELRAKGMTAAEVGKVLGCSRATVYRHLAATHDAPRAPEDGPA